MQESSADYVNYPFYSKLSLFELSIRLKNAKLMSFDVYSINIFDQTGKDSSIFK